MPSGSPSDSAPAMPERKAYSAEQPAPLATSYSQVRSVSNMAGIVSEIEQRTPASNHPKRVVVDRIDHSGSQVGHRTDSQTMVWPASSWRRSAILDGADPVADPVSPEDIDRATDRIRSRRLACVGDRSSPASSPCGMPFERLRGWEPASGPPNPSPTTPRCGTWRLRAVSRLCPVRRRGCPSSAEPRPRPFLDIVGAVAEPGEDLVPVAPPPIRSAGVNIPRCTRHRATAPPRRNRRRPDGSHCYRWMAGVTVILHRPRKCAKSRNRIEAGQTGLVRDRQGEPVPGGHLEESPGRTAPSRWT